MSPADESTSGVSSASSRSLAVSIGRPPPRSGVRAALSDALIEATRHLRIIPRNPELMIFATLQPVTFLLLTTFVFGDAIDVDGYDDYTQFLIPGVLAQAVVFNSAFTSVGIAEDMEKGFMDRLRSLPMSRSAVLLGRTFSDLVRNTITFHISLLAALLIGFRFGGGLFEIAGASALLLFFSYSLAWIQTLIGLSVSSVESANSAGFIWMFPVTFVSSVYVDPDLMPGWLQPVARANPLSSATDACRALYNGRDPGDSVWIALAWSLGLMVVVGAICVRKFSRSTVG